MQKQVRHKTGTGFTNLLLSLLFFPNILFAQEVPPDAGVLQQQIERNQPIVLPKQSLPKKEKKAEEKVSPKGETAVVVKQFRFAGNKLLSNKELEPVVASYLNRRLDFNELQAAAAAVANTYRELGWVVRTSLPSQDLDDGVVTIQITESIFKGVNLEGEKPKYISEKMLFKIIETHQKSGEPLNTHALDRSLLLTEDVPGMTVSGSMRAGTRPGETNLVLKVLGEKRINGNVAVDNTGSRSTGRERVSANAFLNSPLKMADQLGGNFIHTEGSDYIRLNWMAPIYYDGLRAGINGSYLKYDVISEEFKTLSAHGNSSTAGIQMTYPLVRSRLKNIYVGFSYDHKAFDNYANQAKTSNYHIDNVSANLNSNFFDNWGGGGTNNLNIAVTQGNVSLGEIQASESRTQIGNFSKATYSFFRQQTISELVSANFNLSGQITDGVLNTAEKFYLGGAGGVKAYPSSEGSGDNGLLANAELLFMLPKGVTLSSFYDYGRVNNHDNSPEYSLKGAGLSAVWVTPLQLQLKGVWARRIGSNPNATLSGKDQDGSLQRNRWWLNAIMPF
jgi:hemolysin activation/secretion protein